MDAAPNAAKSDGIQIVEFIVPEGIDISVFQENATCEATQYDDEGRVVGSQSFDQDGPLPVHNMVSSHNWDVDPCQHILGVSYTDGKFTYACSFDQAAIQEVGSRVITMASPVSIRENWIH